MAVHVILPRGVDVLTERNIFLESSFQQTFNSKDCCMALIFVALDPASVRLLAERNLALTAEGRGLFGGHCTTGN